MIFAYSEDGTLEVVADLTEARRQFESYDVESGAVRLFDEAGKPLVARFPQRSERRIFGFRLDSDPGPYELVPDLIGGETLLKALGPRAVLMTNRWFPNLEAVYAHLKAAA